MEVLIIVGLMVLAYICGLRNRPQPLTGFRKLSVTELRSEFSLRSEWIREDEIRRELERKLMALLIEEKQIKVEREAGAILYKIDLYIKDKEESLGAQVPKSANPEPS